VRKAILAFALFLLAAAQAPAQQVLPVMGSSQAPAGGSAPTFGLAGNCATGGANCVMTVNVTAGQKLLVMGTSTTLANTFSISDANSNAYTAAYSPFTNSGSTVEMAAWLASVGTTNAALAITMHVTGTANFASAVVFVVNPGSLAWVIDQTPATNSYVVVASGTATTGTSGTTTSTNELIVGQFAATPSSGAGGWTQGAGYTIPTNGDVQATGHDTVAEYQIVSTTGAFQATASPANPSTGGGILISIK
jgi:hypothetical protein